MGYLNHLRKWEDLVTSYQATRAGFISIAFEKSLKATPFVEEAKSLKSLLAQIKKPEQLLGMKEIYPSLLTAAGISDKSLNHFNDDDKKEAEERIDAFEKGYLRAIPAGAQGES